MKETKNWYESRTVITGIMGVVFSVLAVFGIIPDPITQEFVLEIVIGVLGVLTVIFRYVSTKKIVKKSEITD